MSESETAATARVYLHTGWKVFPAWWAARGVCACPAGVGCASPGKHPMVRRGVHDASADHRTVAGWWAAWPLANIALPAGANGLAVLDVDPRHGGMNSLTRLGADLDTRGMTLPATVTAVTGSGGLHLYYLAPADGIKGGANVFGPALPGLDTRGRGGYVIAAPSRHACGGTYQWLNFSAQMAPWPGALDALMTSGGTR